MIILCTCNKCGNVDGKEKEVQINSSHRPGEVEETFYKTMVALATFGQVNCSVCQSTNVTITKGASNVSTTS